MNSLNLIHADTNTWSSLFSQPAAEGTGVLQRYVRDAACGEAKLWSFTSSTSRTHWAELPLDARQCWGRAPSERLLPQSYRPHRAGDKKRVNALCLGSEHLTAACPHFRHCQGTWPGLNLCSGPAGVSRHIPQGAINPPGQAGISPGLTWQPGLSCRKDEGPLPERKTPASGLNSSVLCIVFAYLWCALE